MFSHVMLGADDIPAAKKFYDATLGALGLPEGRIDDKGRVGYFTRTGILMITQPIDGGPWSLAWQPSAGQGTGSCVATTLDLAALRGTTSVRFRFSSGSSIANGARFDDIVLDPGRPPHNCCVIGANGCASAAVESCVCAADSYCCLVAWDALCVASATLLMLVS